LFALLMTMENPPPITSPYAPDLGEVRAWLEKMIRAMRFVELVAAIIAFVARLCEVNGELQKRLAELRRRRPRSEMLERLERQLVLPLAGLAGYAAVSGSTRGDGAKQNRPSAAARAAIPGAPASLLTSSASRSSIRCRGSAPRFQDQVERRCRGTAEA
jgi:hypothetical protein